MARGRCWLQEVTAITGISMSGMFGVAGCHWGDEGWGGEDATGQGGLSWFATSLSVSLASTHRLSAGKSGEGMKWGQRGVEANA